MINQILGIFEIHESEVRIAKIKFIFRTDFSIKVKIYESILI
jgi:hypothetical protein